MQTKATIFFLSVSVYLLGLVAFSNHRAAAAHRDSRQPRVLPGATLLTEAIDVAVKKSLPKRPRQQAIAAAPDKLPKADPVIVSTIHAFNDDIGRKEAAGLAHMIEKTAKRYNVDPLLVTALVSQESAFYTDAVSPVGAIGLGQLMPYTAADLGVDPNDPAENLDGCVRYLAQNLDTWAHTNDPVALALASYNAGPGAVSSYGGIPPYEETQNYVAIITSRYQWLLNENLASTSEVYG